MNKMDLMFFMNKDGNRSNLTQDPCDPNPIGSDLSRIKMDFDRIWISMHGSKADLEQIHIYLNINIQIHIHSSFNVIYFKKFLTIM